LQGWYGPAAHGTISRPTEDVDVSADAPRARRGPYRHARQETGDLADAFYGSDQEIDVHDTYDRWPCRAPAVRRATSALCHRPLHALQPTPESG
jgi:hypothetical protein